MIELTPYRSKERNRTVTILFYRKRGPLHTQFMFCRIDARRWYIIARLWSFGMNFYWDGWSPRFRE